MGLLQFLFNIGGKGCMGLNERIAELEAEKDVYKRQQLSAAGIFIQRSGDCGNRYFW